MKRDFQYYLGKVWFDAMGYQAPQLEFVSNVLGASVQRQNLGGRFHPDGASLSGWSLGCRRLLWGTGHPFYPDASSARWARVEQDLGAIKIMADWSDLEKNAIRGRNAVELFDLPH